MSTLQITRLEALAKEILESGICVALASTATQLVMGDGNPNADIVLIGEAPGKQEDISGKPFQGAAGKSLNEMLADAGLNRDDVYITNIVKWRPPNNRDPSEAEKAESIPYLLKELEIINPKLIITLGRHSMNYFLPGAVIGQIHGQPQTIMFGGREMTLMPLYHPSAAMYNGKLKETLKEDFAKVPGVIKQIKESE